MVQPLLSSHNLDGQSARMKPSPGCETAVLPGWHPSLADTDHLEETEAWLLEVFSAERKKRKNNGQTSSSAVAAVTAEDRRCRLPLHPREGEGRGASAGAVEGPSHQGPTVQGPTDTRSLTTPAPGFSTPEPVPVETWEGLQPVQLNYVDVKQAKRVVPLSLSLRPTPPSYQVVCRSKIVGAFPLQGAMESSTEDNDDTLQNAFRMERRDFADLSRGFAMLSDAERRGVFSRMVGLSKKVFVGDHFEASPMSADTVMLAVNLFAIYLGTMSTESFDSMPQTEIELLPGVCLLAAFKFDEDSALPKLVKVLADDAESWKRVKKQAAKIEWKMLRQTDFRLMTPTLVTFIHLFLERTVLEGAIAQQHALAVRAKATDIAWGWARDGFGVEYFPSELAATALYCTALREYGATTAAKVAVVVECPLYCPRFLRLCLEAKLSPRGTENSTGAGVFTGTDGGSRQKENSGKQVGSIWAGESDTDDNTPLPSAEMQGRHEAFFQEGQTGHNNNYTPCQDASKLKPPPDPDNEGNIGSVPPDDAKEMQVPARAIGHRDQVIASYSSFRNSDWSWENGVDIRATPPPTVRPRQPTPEVEHMRQPVNDDYDPTELATLPIVAEDSRNALTGVAAYPTPSATAAFPCGVQNRPRTCNGNREKSEARQSPIWSLPSVGGVRGAAFESAFFPTIDQSTQRTEDGVGIGASRNDTSTGRLEEGVHSHDQQSRPALSRRRPEAETVDLYDVDGVSGIERYAVDAPPGEELRYFIPSVVDTTRLASEARLPPVGHPSDGQRAQHATLDDGGGSGGRSRDGDIFEDRLPFAIQSPSRSLLAPTDLWNGDEGDWLRMVTRDLEAAGEALRPAESALVAELDLALLYWTRGGVLVPRNPRGRGGGGRRRERR